MTELGTAPRWDAQNIAQLRGEHGYKNPRSPKCRQVSLPLRISTARSHHGLP